MNIPILIENFGVTLDWLGTAIQWLIGIGPIVGVGIILFTIILKTVVLPLDAFSKVKMRKNNLKMEKMRPQLEKLQKQYANDKQAYNAKMMELYKKNGYSMLGPCLPMIVTLVIFIFVMSAFSSYSNYTNLHTYEQMAESYNAAILQYSVGAEDEEAVTTDSDWTAFYTGSGEEQVFQYYRMERVYNSDAADCLIETRVTYYYDPPTETEEEGVYTEEELAALTPEERETYLDGLLAENKTSGIISTSYTVKTAAVLDAAKLEDEAFAPVAAAAEKLKNNTYQDNEGFTANDYRAREIMQQVGRDASSNIYYSVRDSFLWVNNIWEPDVSYEHPVKMPNVTNSLFTQETFNELTYNLSAEKAAPNGYFILIILSIGFMFLSQFIISRSQKAQNELQTADGRGKKTQKIMMIVMPVIYGIFAFFYSAAFTIYMITSSVYNVVSTLIINAIIDRRFRKREEQEIQDKYNKRLPQHAASGAVSKASAGTNNRQSVNKQLRQNKLRISEKEKKSADTNREKRNGGK